MALSERDRIPYNQLKPDYLAHIIPRLSEDLRAETDAEKRSQIASLLVRAEIISADQNSGREVPPADYDAFNRELEAFNKQKEREA